MRKEELIDGIEDAIFDLSLAMNEEFGGYHQDIPEKYRVVLILLSRYETLYVKDVAHFLHLSSSSASQLLSRMESENYIVRELDPQRRTFTFVKLGDQGQERVREMKATRNEIASKYLMKLSKEDLVTFKDIAVKIKEIVEKEKEAIQ